MSRIARRAASLRPPQRRKRWRKRCQSGAAAPHARAARLALPRRGPRRAHAGALAAPTVQGAELAAPVATRGEGARGGAVR